ncbi:hypothetical protein AHAS_Ahas17G0089500 [Arachis hypogaea]
MTSIIIKIKNAIKEIPCISILDLLAKLIVETDASDLGYGGILKQIPPNSSKEQIVKYHLRIWNQAQKNYATVKKEILAIVLCVSKFQEDLFNKTFIIRIDCKIFARWYAILSCFDFTIEHIKGELNSLPDFFIREFLQEKNGSKFSLYKNIIIKTYDYVTCCKSIITRGGNRPGGLPGACSLACVRPDLAWPDRK